MSGIDSEQDKQPISSVNGEASDVNMQCSGKDVVGDQTTPAEGIKDATPVSCQSESKETKKDDEDQSKDSNSAEMTVNGVGQAVDDQEKSEPSENLGESSGEEAKPSESHGEPAGDEQVNGEGIEAEAGKEGESSVESKEAEPSTETVALETNGEQGKTSGENQECEQSVEAVAMDTISKEGDGNKESDQGHESVGTATSGEEVETSGASKESEPVGAQANGEQAESKDSEASPEPVAMEISGEQVKVETTPSEMESAHTEAEEGTKTEDPEVTPGDQLEHQPSEESNITETDTDAVEKKRAVTIDSPGNVKEPDETDVKTKEERSKTVGDIEDNANKSTVEVEDTLSKPDSEAAAPDEAVSYQTSIVGGVVHKVPINSYSPKGQRKPREGSPQTQPKKKSVIEALFGRRKKSKGGPESPPGTSPKGKGDKKEDEQELPEADTSGKDVEKEKLPEQPESGSVIPGANADTVKATTEPAESGAGAEEESTCDTDNKQETEGKEPAAETEGNGEVEVQPAVAEQSEEGVKDKTLQDVEESNQAEIEAQDGKGDSAAVESMAQEKEKENTGEPKDEQPKEGDKQAHTDSPEGETSSQPTPKKKKSTGLFGGFFARRKSRKTKDAAASPPEEKADDKVEEPQDEGVSTPSTGEVAGTDQGVAPAAAAAAAAAANEGQLDAANPQNEATEGAIIPAVNQTVESAKEKISDSDKLDVAAGREEADAGVSEKPEVPVKSAVPEDVQTSSEEPLQSEESGDAAEKSAEKTVESDTAEDSQPKAQQEEEHLIQPKIEVNNMATEEGEAAEDTTTPQVEEPKKEDDSAKETVEKASPESEEIQDEATELKERTALRNGGSYSPKTRRMQMRISYAETDGEGGKEVEVIGTPEKAPEVTNQKGKADHKVSCRALGEADHEGWLSKKGGMLFLTGWKRKWVVLKDGKLYYFRTAFDLEAGGVINMQGNTVAEAPETKKKFCFKCEQPGAKPQVTVFMSDSKEDMDKWLTVLVAASRGEVIQKPKQQQLAVMGEVTMRKKTGSTSAQRHSSILALGGRHDFLEDEEDRKATRRRSTPGSFSKVPKETEEEGKKTAVRSGTNQAPIDEKPADEPPAPNDQQQVASDAPSEPCGEQSALSASSNEHLAPSDTPKEPASPDEAPEEKTESGESKTTEKTVTVVVDEIFVGSEKVVVESTSSTVEVSTSETTTTDVKISEDAAPVVSNEEEKESEASSKVSEEVTGATEKHDSSTDGESPADKIDGAVIATTRESSVTVVETVKTAVEISETVETSTLVFDVQTEVQETSEADQKPEVKEGVSEATLSEASAPLESEASEITPPKDSSSPPESPSKTKWYFSLDRKQTWSVAPEPEDEKASKRSKSRPSKSSDRASIKSTSSDNESVKSLPDDDELMRLCRNIRKARLSIVGEPVPDGAERLRALSNVQGSDVAIMRLKTLERTLKDKEQHLSDLEELLNQPEINRQSIHEWKLRNSDLLEDLFPQEDGEGQNEDEKAAEGGESETQKQDKLEEDGAEKEEIEESTEEMKEKLDEAKEEPSGSKEEGDGNVDEKQSVPEEEVTGEDEQKLGKDEQQSTEKEEEKEKEKEDENVLTEEGAVEQEESSAESVPPTETEATDGKPEHEKDISPETSSAQKSSEQSKEQEESEDVMDTQF